jgi:hypothetical protein
MRIMKKKIENNFALAAFLATCRLINERRDTLSYSLITASVISEFLSGNSIGAIERFAMFVALREGVLRGMKWSRYPEEERVLAGGAAPTVDYRANAAAALVVGGPFFAIVGSMGAKQNPSLMLLGAACVVMGTVQLRKHGRGVRDIPDLYFNDANGMWDWPSRQGGTTQTQKLMDGFKDLGRKIGQAVKPPRPVLGFISESQAAKPSA